MTKEDLEKIRNQIIEGELVEGLESLEILLKTASSRYREEVILHLASAKDLKRDMRMGTITSERANQERNRLNYNVLQLIEELESLN